MSLSVKTRSHSCLQSCRRYTSSLIVFLAAMNIPPKTREISLIFPVQNKLANLMMQLQNFTHLHTGVMKLCRCWKHFDGRLLPELNSSISQFYNVFRDNFWDCKEWWDCAQPSCHDWAKDIVDSERKRIRAFKQIPMFKKKRGNAHKYNIYANNQFHRLWLCEHFNSSGI